MELLASQDVRKDTVAAKKREREELPLEDLLVVKQQERELKKLKKENCKHLKDKKTENAIQLLAQAAAEVQI